jgi:two-component system, NarL family, response regulator DesR
MRLFLCDDNAQYRQLAKLVLEGAGAEIVGEAGDGAEAIERAPEVAPDVVLLDLNMPGVNGFEALPVLRERLPAETKILVLTTGQAPQEREQCLDAGADAFVVKPERIYALEEAVRSALEEVEGG